MNESGTNLSSSFIPATSSHCASVVVVDGMVVDVDSPGMVVWGVVDGCNVVVVVATVRNI